mmetsp:Transcript_8279/g.19613  ORF Transcript_8279/g.19613 Transcript_8279/m.19613 type:complete len:249 (-) Transcript_8279:1753-2499(-)
MPVAPYRCLSEQRKAPPSVAVAELLPQEQYVHLATSIQADRVHRVVEDRQLDFLEGADRPRAEILHVHVLAHEICRGDLCRRLEKRGAERRDLAAETPRDVVVVGLGLGQCQELLLERHDLTAKGLVLLDVGVEVLRLVLAVHFQVVFELSLVHQLCLEGLLELLLIRRDFGDAGLQRRFLAHELRRHEDLAVQLALQLCLPRQVLLVLGRRRRHFDSPHARTLPPPLNVLLVHPCYRPIAVDAPLGW